MPVKRSYIGNDAPKASKVKHAKTSILSDVPTYREELEKKYLELASVDIRDIDKRLALLARINLESVLKSASGLSPEKLADISLRTISTLEGAKSKSELWVKEVTKEPVPMSVEEYEKERAAVEQRIWALLTRKQARSPVQRAEDALEAVELGLEVDEVKDA